MNRGLVLLLGGLLACASSREPQPPGPPAEAAPVAQAPADYLVVGPAALVAEVRPLIALRTRLGHSVRVVTLEQIAERRHGTEPVLDEIRGRAAEAPTLRYLLLLGDPAAGGAPSFDRQAGDGLRYNTDQPYALAERHPPLAVGRIPARTPAEVRAAVDKIVAYETGPVHGDWARRISVFAGPGNFGAIADAFLERAATAILDSIPYDFDIRVTFAKPDSPYAYAFDRLTGKIADELAAGALVAVYTGHGSERSLDSVMWRGQWYSIGDTEGLAGVRTAQGNPFFISLTCLTGAFGRPDAPRSLAEEMALNRDGPVATFAASARSHPLANIALGQGFLEHLFRHRVGTIGEAVREARKGLERPNVPQISFLTDDDDGQMWKENDAMYNLFGDPATRLRYPEAAEVVAAATSAPGAVQKVAVSAPGVASGTLVVTLEIARTQVRDGMIDGDQIEKLDRDAAFDAMIANNRKANDRVLLRAEAAIRGGRGEVELTMPAVGGRYAIKALVDGGGKVAAGSAWVQVAAP